MKLSPDQLSQIAAALGCVEAVGGEDNRGIVRVPMGTRASIIPCSDSRREVATIVVLNLSNTGIGILNNIPMRNGENFILHLPAVKSNPTPAVLCTVIYAQPIPMGMYAVGAQYTRILGAPGERTTAERPAIGTPPEPQVAPPASELSDHDFDHIREVESRLKQLMH